MKRQPWTLAFLVLVLVATTSVGWAKKPKADPPAEESVCDDFEGPAGGLCKAYCEALDCDTDDPRGSGKNCDKMLDHFQRLTGEDPPCLTVPAGPCPAVCADGVEQYLNEAFSLPYTLHLLDCVYDGTREAGLISHTGFGTTFSFTFANILDETCSAEIWETSGHISTFVPLTYITPEEQAACAALFADDFAALTGQTCNVSPPPAP